MCTWWATQTTYFHLAEWVCLIIVPCYAGYLSTPLSFCAISVAKHGIQRQLWMYCSVTVLHPTLCSPKSVIWLYTFNPVSSIHALIGRCTKLVLYSLSPGSTGAYILWRCTHSLHPSLPPSIHPSINPSLSLSLSLSHSLSLSLSSLSLFSLSLLSLSLLSLFSLSLSTQTHTHTTNLSRFLSGDHPPGASCPGSDRCCRPITGQSTKPRLQTQWFTWPVPATGVSGHGPLLVRLLSAIHRSWWLNHISAGGYDNRVLFSHQSHFCVKCYDLLRA